MGFGAEVITRRQNKIAKLFYEKAAFSESQSLSENMVLGSKEVNLRTLSLYCFSSGSSNECEMNKKPPAMPVRLNGFSEKIPPMLR